MNKGGTFSGPGYQYPNLENSEWTVIQGEKELLDCEGNNETVFNQSAKMIPMERKISSILYQKVEGRGSGRKEDPIKYTEPGGLLLAFFISPGDKIESDRYKNLSVDVFDEQNNKVAEDSVGFLWRYAGQPGNETYRITFNTQVKGVYRVCITVPERTGSDKLVRTELYIKVELPYNSAKMIVPENIIQEVVEEVSETQDVLEQEITE